MLEEQLEEEEKEQKWMYTEAPRPRMWRRKPIRKVIDIDEKDVDVESITSGEDSDDWDSDYTGSGGSDVEEIVQPRGRSQLIFPSLQEVHMRVVDHEVETPRKQPPSSAGETGLLAFLSKSRQTKLQEASPERTSTPPPRRVSAAAAAPLTPPPAVGPVLAKRKKNWKNILEEQEQMLKQRQAELPKEEEYVDEQFTREPEKEQGEELGACPEEQPQEEQEQEQLSEHEELQSQQQQHTQVQHKQEQDNLQEQQQHELTKNQQEQRLEEHQETLHRQEQQDFTTQGQQEAPQETQAKCQHAQQPESRSKEAEFEEGEEFLGPALEEPLRLAEDDEGQVQGHDEEDLRAELAKRRRQLQEKLFSSGGGKRKRPKSWEDRWLQPPAGFVKAEPRAKRELFSVAVKQEPRLAVPEPAPAAPEPAPSPTAMAASPSPQVPEVAAADPGLAANVQMERMQDQTPKTGLLKRRRRGAGHQEESQELSATMGGSSLLTPGSRTLKGLPRADLLRMAGQLE
eukprot:CAMPEP_0197680550 /NCGR_PEP_ID=MMETSP1338-20131121/93502_1 /TAXON_ID=43686 ORGANISM="Pelagodinium beii, Strain RCC1491" /NCGR_SAMPLE_ID=MMETSP1338 /ASSEMBLY_ACC=CAM_ASM_000754 /LENGTH=512 /DNA_ID=CAMNT_0043261751 /DNA_START=39 /DNA_END=1574 /DNA_ORIENTATION=-